MTSPQSSPSGAPERTYTEREKIDAQREAFDKGARWADYVASPSHHAFFSEAEVRSAAASRYPLPKVERPRVVHDPAIPANDFRIVDGHLEYCSNGEHQWARGGMWVVTPRRLEVWADLFANPTELVDAAAALPSTGAETAE